MPALGPLPGFAMHAAGWLPLLVAALALVDLLRRGGAWWWILPILFVPLVGPIAYFAATRGPWAAGPVPDARVLRRAGAKQRLAELEQRLAHWRGPALLAESAEELLTLGRAKEAEARFREAREAGAPLADWAMGLAESLVAGRRPAEAVPVLRELLAAEPDFRMGAASLLLARCLDETDDRAAAEAALRQVLARRTLPEARARLARLLLLRGERAEAEALVAEIVRDAGAASRALARQQRPWARYATGLLKGRTELPRVPRGSA